MSGSLAAGGGGRSPLSEATRPILTLTVNPTVDICCEVDRLADIGKTRAQVRFVAAGGGGINVARGVSRLGGRATAIHTAGREVGQRLNRLLDEEGVDHLALGIAGETREAFVLFETESRRSYHIVPPGPRLDEHEGGRLLDALDRAAGSHPYVVASGSLPGGLPDDFYAAVARRVKGAGSQLVLDTSGRALHESLQESVFLRRCNNHEAASLAGRAVRSFDDARAVNEYLLAAGATEVAITTLGELGALCSTRHGHTQLRAPGLPGEPLSDAGAGDAMVAALTFRLAAGDDPVEACALGVAVAAASVLTPDTEPFDREVAESLYPAVRTSRQVGS
ncbi:1-phosphofructokinase family hexose kinase [Kitasatospora sp. NBC_01266]|uniref:1-phosphofructokinase family hexose kinase n=1 Tax=Kitasatospora sp. NBC_01266 TaxID=2903572 RepID=UPI002E37BBB6|nr:hexose kinase [Kitasatospora sp. NBC_01266]